MEEKSDRERLKALFGYGKKPSESDFESLIDSTVNKSDDGISKSETNGWEIRPANDDDKVLQSFYSENNDLEPSWKIKIKRESDGVDGHSGFKNKSSLVISENNGGEDSEELKVLKLHPKGKVGILKDQPKYSLDVKGFIGSTGRIGNFWKETTDSDKKSQNEILADGKWKNIVENLTGCHGFEVIARVGVKNQGRYALLHAIALKTFARGRGKINKTSCQFGSWINKIKIRWKRDGAKYHLQMKTIGNYGEGVKIKYFITQLWDDDMLMDD